MNKFEYKNLTPFKWFVLENFPFIEADFDALTEWQLFCKLGKEMNKIITSENTLGTQVESVTNAFIELQNYVNNYFNNLDIQEEINTKLNEMTEDGTLAKIINEDIFNELNEKINNIEMSTLLNIVDNIPEEKTDNTQYEKINYSDTIDNLPKSNYVLILDANKTAEENYNNNILRVGTFNIENENVPYNIGTKGLEKINKLKYIYNKLKCNILGLNEVFESFLFPIKNLYETDFYKFNSFGSTFENILPNANAGNLTISNIDNSSNTSALYENQYTQSIDRYGYLKSVFSYNNKIISFYCTHFCPYDNVVLQNQITELYNIIQQDENPYKIIVGDFNLDLLNNSNQYLSSFLNAGFKQVNGGKYVTYPSNGLSIDEILVSSNINIINSNVFTIQDIFNLSDHLPVWAELRLEE